MGNHVRVLNGAILDATHGRIEIGDGAVICRYAVLEAAGGAIRIGRRVSVGDFSSIYGQAGLDIGEDVLIASGVRVVPSGHVWDDDTTPISKQGLVGRGVQIGAGSWIGTNTVILDGVRVGAGAIVGAGSVVTRDVPNHTIVAGVPARVMRER